MDLTNTTIYARHFTLVQLAFTVLIVWYTLFQAGTQHRVESGAHRVELHLCHIQLALVDFL